VNAEWPTVRLKFLGRFKGGAGFPHDEQGNQNAELPFYKVKDIGQSNDDGILRKTENYVSREASRNLGAFVFPPETIVFAKVGAALLLKRFRILSRPGCIDNNMMGFMPHSNVCDTKFALSALNLLNFADIVNPGAVPSLKEEQISEQVLPLPPLQEQRAIANFLDRETARLDALTAEKELWLELVSEKRRAFITRAVMRGINPAAPLRDSGLHWLDQIPAHWKTKRNAFLFRERDERGYPDLPLLEVSINAGVILREFSDDQIESVASDFNSYKVARKGDIAFNKMRMWQGEVGVAPEDGLVSPDYTVAVPLGELLQDYTELLFRTGAFSAECCRHSHGIVWDRLRLYWDGFRDIRIPVPPLPEQRAIVAHISAETAKLDALRVATERTIGLLKERRAALIAAAVTGKLGVPTNPPSGKLEGAHEN
jgi:restriction endonuclease S subunit